jgi:hypothetical protein
MLRGIMERKSRGERGKGEAFFVSRLERGPGRQESPREQKVLESGEELGEGHGFSSGSKPMEHSIKGEVQDRREYSRGYIDHLRRAKLRREKPEGVSWLRDASGGILAGS